MPEDERNPRREKNNIEKRSPGDKGCLPILRDKDVPNRLTQPSKFLDIFTVRETKEAAVSVVVEVKNMISPVKYTDTRNATENRRMRTIRQQ